MQPYLPSDKTLKAIIAFYREARSLNDNQWNLRSRFEDIDRLYMREQDYTEAEWKAELHNKSGDPSKFRNIQVPIVMPQVENAVTYQQSVFLTGSPIFGAVATPAHEDAALQLDTIVSEQQLKFNWVPELLKTLRSGFKYNFAPIETSWERQVSYSLGATGKAAQEKVIYEGNKLTSLCPYNTFLDSRVSPVDIPKEGEFAGYTMRKSRIATKAFIAALPVSINVKDALETATPGGTGSTGEDDYYTPRINLASIYELDQFAGTDWYQWAGLQDKKGAKIAYSNSYEITVLYGRILPSDFSMTGIPAPNTPQVWKFIIVNSQVVIYAERMTNVHQLIPIVCMQPYEDGLGYQTKSLASNLEPFQQVSSALINSTIAARRRAIGDRLVYDPSRISAGLLDSDDPIARIPVRPSAFGTPLDQAVKVLPFRDDQSQHAMQSMGMLEQLANKTSGLNPARQGSFVKGNKTRHEFQETMGYANGRDQTIALTLEGNGFGPIKHLVKTNILQYQGGTELYSAAVEGTVAIDPVALRKASLDFKLSDGLAPSDKLIDGDSLGQALQTLAQSQELAAGYNLAPMFSYLMKSRGANLTPFEKTPEQQAYEQAVGAWQQTVTSIYDKLLKAQPEIGVDELQKALPPQPTPEQYGYDPKAPPSAVTSTDGTTVMGRYMETEQAGKQAAAPQAALTGGDTNE